jgi:hypothetical protein
MTIVKNLVDERYELVSLVFRLAERAAYSNASSKYEKEINKRFSGYKQHPVVTFALANPDIDYDAVFNMAVHLKKIDAQFILVDDIKMLFWDKEILPRWTKENVNEFVPLLNNFYLESGFGDFFNEQRGFHIKQSEGFERDFLKQFNYKWFEAHGINPTNLRVVLSPASGGNCYGATVCGASPHANIVYAALPYFRSFPKSVAIRMGIRAMVHEYCHSFANPIATSWYAENDQFRKWCNDSVNTELMPSYATGIAMAYEYVTRSYEVLYMTENAKINVKKELARHKTQGFLFIEDVYAIITTNSTN